MFSQKTYNYVKLHESEMISIKHQILHSLRMFLVSSQAFAQTFSLQTHQLPVLAFRFHKRDKLTSYVDLLLRLHALLFRLLPENY